MATITEDYCDFETAKLLKEKGFDARCPMIYTADGEMLYTDVKHHNMYAVTNKQLEYYTDIIAPTQAMALKWLREVYNIMVSPYALSLGYYFEIFDLTNRDITGCKPLYKVGIPNKEDVLNTYEEACEAAIKYCLENLI